MKHRWPAWSLVLALTLTLLAPGFVSAAQNEATLTMLEGTADVVLGSSGERHSAANGETLHEGDRIITASPGKALLTFFDGSEQELGESSEVLIQALGQTSGGGILIRLAQAGGQTINRVAQLGNADDYEVQTPNTTAYVRGTRFFVGVEIDPQDSRKVTREVISVEEGQVEVRLGQQVRIVNPGEKLTVTPAQDGTLEIVGQTPSTSIEPSAPSGLPDLNGVWSSGESNIRIEQTGDQVAGYRQDGPFVCDYQDGTGRTDQVDAIFQATLRGNELTGVTPLCFYGSANPQGVGFKNVPLHLTLSDDGNTLTGAYDDTSTGTQVVVNLTRDS